MIIIFGTRLMGKVDDVPGLFHVATRFWHLWYLPIIPMGTMLVFSKSGNSYRGKAIGFSAKSWLVAWLRVVLGFGAILAIGTGVVLLSDARPKVAGGIALSIAGLASAGMLLGSYFVTGLGRASYARAVAIAESAELSEEALVRIELAFGRISEEDAKKTLAELEAAGEEMERLQQQASPAPEPSADAG